MTEPRKSPRTANSRLERSLAISVAAFVYALTTAAHSQAAQRSAHQPGALRSGGLQAPRAPDRGRQTVQQLQRGELENTGRGLQFFWFDAGAGYRRLWVDALASKSLLDSTQPSPSGNALDLQVGAGVRIVFLSAGAKLHRSTSKAWEQWSLGGELGLHFPLGNWEPSLALSVGYAWLSPLEGSKGQFGDAGSDLNIGGMDLGIGGQMAWYPLPFLSLAVRSDLELLLLTRPALASATAGSVYSQEGSAIGLSLSLLSLIGLHF